MASDTDVPLVLIYEDTNQDNVIDDLTSPIGQASFSSGSATVSNLGSIALSATTNWLIAYGIDINANQTNSAGGQINSTDITGGQGTSITFSGITTGSYTLPVELTHLSAEWEGSAVELYWRTETDNLKWIIQRSLHRDTGYEVVYEEFKQAGEMTTPFPTEYHFLDTQVEPGRTYYYLLVDVAIDGIHTYHGPVSTAGHSLTDKALSGNLLITPNPFDRKTTLWVNQTAEPVTFRIYSTLGELVGEWDAGPGAQTQWDGNDQAGRPVSAGTYICRTFRETDQGWQPLAEGKLHKLKQLWLNGFLSVILFLPPDRTGRI